jgi:hypothetical protein
VEFVLLRADVQKIKAKSILIENNERQNNRSKSADEGTAG